MTSTEPVIDRLFALSAASKQHESFARLYGKTEEQYKGKSSTKRTKKKHAAGKGEMERTRRIFGLDCEMVLTAARSDADDEQYTLARASLVEFSIEKDDFEVAFDVFVKPPEDRVVKDFLEYVSGVSEEHLKEAEHSIDDVIELLEKHVKPTDLIIGHSLWSDFEALKWWHDTFVDTSLFFKVSIAPKLTLGLKDAVLHSLNANEAHEKFQSGGKAHNSVTDAQFAVRVARFLATAPDGPFVQLEDVPARFKKSLTFHGFNPNRSDIELTKVLHDIAAQYGATIPKPMKIATRPDGGETGSVTFEFSSPEAALEALGTMPVNEKKSHPQGFPDHAGFIRKLVKFNQNAPIFGELISYHRMNMNRILEEVFEKRGIGSIIGSKGARILHIQRLCGTHISNVPKEGNKNKVVFTIKSDDELKCTESLRLMKLGEDLEM